MNSDSMQQRRHTKRLDERPGDRETDGTDGIDRGYLNVEGVDDSSVVSTYVGMLSMGKMGIFRVVLYQHFRGPGCEWGGVALQHTFYYRYPAFQDQSLHSQQLLFLQ